MSSILFYEESYVTEISCLETSSWKEVYMDFYET